MTLAAAPALVLLSGAFAHVGDVIDTRDAGPPGPAGVVIEATFGLLLPDGPAAWDWVCHEVVTEPWAIVSPDYAVTEHRITSWMADLAQARDGIGVWVSEDGCGWSPATGLDGRVVSAISEAPDGSSWAATADPADNALFWAPDGRSFEPVLTSPGRFLSVRADGPAVWAVSSEPDGGLQVWHAVDGQTFSAHPVPIPGGLTEPIRGWIGAVHPDDPTRAWLILDPIGTDRVFALEAGGAQATQVWDAPDRVTDLERGPDGTLYAVLNDRRPWRALPGQPFEPLTELADGSGLGVSAHGLALANRTFVNHLLLTVSEDGLTPTRTLRPDAIRGPLPCPADSELAAVCEPLWAQLAPRLLPRPDPGPTPPPPRPEPPPAEGCACASSAPSVWAGPALLLALLRRRARGPNAGKAGAIPGARQSPTG